MAIRKVIECDFCGEEVGDNHYIIKAREFNSGIWEADLVFYAGYKRRIIICDECRHHIKEFLMRLSDLKKRKQEG